MSSCCAHDAYVQTFWEKAAHLLYNWPGVQLGSRVVGCGANDLDAPLVRTVVRLRAWPVQK